MPRGRTCPSLSAWTIPRSASAIFRGRGFVSIGCFHSMISVPRMLITDAQVHLWEVDRPGRPWPSRPQRPPHRPHGFSAEAMLAEMESAGVDRAVIVPPHWVGDNNAFAIERATKYPGRFGVVGRIDLK